MKVPTHPHLFSLGNGSPFTVTITTEEIRFRLLLCETPSVNPLFVSPRLAELHLPVTSPQEQQSEELCRTKI